MHTILPIIGALAVAGAVAPGAQQASPALDLAVHHAVLDFCVARMLDPSRPDDQLAKQAGVELLPSTPGAGPFADAKSMRPIFALHPSANDKSMVDGLAASGSARESCLVRIVDADGGEKSLVGFLRGAADWSLAGEETRGTVHMVSFRRLAAGQSYDVGLDVADDVDGAKRPDGMRAMISVRPLQKSPK